MGKISLLLLIAIAIAGAVYAVHVYAANSSNTAETSVKAGGNSAQCPINADCTRDGNCSGADCSNYADTDKDGQCDRQQACHGGSADTGCPGRAARGYGGCHN